MIAARFALMVLGDLGAEVIKGRAVRGGPVAPQPRVRPEREQTELARNPEPLPQPRFASNPRPSGSRALATRRATARPAALRARTRPNARCHARRQEGTSVRFFDAPWAPGAR